MPRRKPSRPTFYAAQHQMTDSVKRYGAAQQSVFNGCLDNTHVKAFQQAQNLYILSLACGSRSTFQYPLQGLKRLGKLPVL
jgi:hypothetical protein